MTRKTNTHSLFSNQKTGGFSTEQLLQTLPTLTCENTYIWFQLSKDRQKSYRMDYLDGFIHQIMTSHLDLRRDDVCEIIIGNIIMLDNQKISHCRLTLARQSKDSHWNVTSFKADPKRLSSTDLNLNLSIIREKFLSSSSCKSLKS